MTVTSPSFSLLKIQKNGDSSHLKRDEPNFYSTSEVTTCVGVRSAKACRTENGFSCVSKQHSRPLLFPFFPHAAYSWIFQQGLASLTRSIKLFTTFSDSHTAGLAGKRTVTVRQPPSIFRHFKTSQFNAQLHISCNNGGFCALPHS